MARKLKVYRTTAGFSDAYVAAPSKKAALAAWGAEADLFARGIAEVVTDPALMAEPLARPGEVLEVSRGDHSAHLRALKDKPALKKAGSTPAPKFEARAKKARKQRQAPPPKRDRLDAAEAALAEAEKRGRKAVARLQAQRDAAERALERACAGRDKELATLTRSRNAARNAYEEALERWSN